MKTQTCQYPSCGCDHLDNCESRRKTKLKDLKYQIPGVESPRMKYELLMGAFGFPLLAFIIAFLVIPLADAMNVSLLNILAMILVIVFLYLAVLYRVWRRMTR